MWAEFPGGRARLLAGPHRARSPRSRPSPKVTDGTWTAGSWPAAALYFVGMNMTDATLGPSLDLRKAICQSADAQTVVDDVSEGVAEVATGYVPAGIPGLQGRSEPVPLRSRERHLRGDHHGRRPDARLLVRHQRGPRADRRHPGDRVEPGRPHRQGERVRVGDVPREALARQQGQRQPALPRGLDRRLPVDGRVPVPARSSPTSRRPAATRSTPTRASTTCCRRRARPWTPSSATTCTRRPRSSSSPTCRPCRCTSTATTASSASRVHGFAVDPMGTTDMRALWLE